MFTIFLTTFFLSLILSLIVSNYSSAWFADLRLINPEIWSLFCFPGTFDEFSRLLSSSSTSPTACFYCCWYSYLRSTSSWWTPWKLFTISWTYSLVLMSFYFNNSTLDWFCSTVWLFIFSISFLASFSPFSSPFFLAFSTNSSAAYFLAISISKVVPTIFSDLIYWLTSDPTSFSLE